MLRENDASPAGLFGKTLLFSPKDALYAGKTVDEETFAFLSRKASTGTVANTANLSSARCGKG